MRIYKTRYILLGLTLVCLMTIETDGLENMCVDEPTLKNPAYKAHKAMIVVEATVKRLHRAPSTRYYNATVRISKLRKIYKGRNIITSRRQKRWSRIRIGPFGDPIAKINECTIGNVALRKRYIFFLNKTTRPQFYRVVSVHVKAVKKTRKQIKKMTCKRCGPSPPVIIKALQSQTVKQGERFRLKCLVKGNPYPVIRWFKDKQNITKLKGLTIIYRRKGSTLRVRKANFHNTGEYICKAVNFVTQTSSVAHIKVIRKYKPVIKPDLDITKNTVYAAKLKACTEQRYCLNGGKCKVIYPSGWISCKCPRQFDGVRCEFLAYNVTMEKLQKFIEAVSDVAFVAAQIKKQTKSECKLKHDRTLVVIGIIVAVFVFIIICIASYILARRKRWQFHSRQNSKRLVRDDNPTPSLNQPLLRDEVDRGQNKRTGVFRLSTATQTAECPTINSITENHIMYKNYSPNIVSSSQPNRPINNSDNGTKRARLNGTCDRHDGASNHTPHEEDTEDDFIPRVSSPNLNNVPVNQGNETFLPCDELYIDESENVHNFHMNDNDSLRETDILGVNDETDDMDSSDEENGRLVCENADNGCKIDQGLFDFTQYKFPHAKSVNSVNNDTLPGKLDGRTSRNSRSSRTSLLSEVDFIHGDHPLSELSSEHQSVIKLCSDLGDEIPALVDGTSDVSSTFGTIDHDSKPDLVNCDERSSVGDELEYAISESSYSNGSTPTGEVLDDLDLDIPEILNKYSDLPLLNEPSLMQPNSPTSDKRPYAAYPYANETPSVNPNVPETKHGYPDSVPNSISSLNDIISNNLQLYK